MKQEHFLLIESLFRKSYKPYIHTVLIQLQIPQTLVYTSMHECFKDIYYILKLRHIQFTIWHSNFFLSSKGYLLPFCLLYLKEPSAEKQVENTDSSFHLIAFDLKHLLRDGFLSYEQCEMCNRSRPFYQLAAGSLEVKLLWKIVFSYKLKL